MLLIYITALLFLSTLILGIHFENKAREALYKDKLFLSSSLHFGADRVYPITQKYTYIGKGKKADLCLKDYKEFEIDGHLKGVAGLHAIITMNEDSSYTIQTFRKRKILINDHGKWELLKWRGADKKIIKRTLKNGTKIKFGEDLILEFRKGEI